MENVDAHSLHCALKSLRECVQREAVDGIQGRTNLSIAIRDAINTKLEQLEGFGGIEAFTTISSFSKNRFETCPPVNFPLTKSRPD